MTTSIACIAEQYKRPREQFAMIPIWLLKHGDVSATAKVIYGLVAGKYGNDGTAWPRQETIAEEFGYSVRTVGTALGVLERVGALSRTRRGRRSGRGGRASDLLTVIGKKLPVSPEVIGKKLPVSPEVIGKKLPVSPPPFRLSISHENSEEIAAVKGRLLLSEPYPLKEEPDVVRLLTAFADNWTLTRQQPYRPRHSDIAKAQDLLARYPLDVLLGKVLGYFEPGASKGYWARHGHSFALFHAQIDQVVDLDLYRREIVREQAETEARHREYARLRAVAEAENAERERLGLPDPLDVLREEMQARQRARELNQKNQKGVHRAA